MVIGGALAVEEQLADAGQCCCLLVVAREALGNARVSRRMETQLFFF